MLIRSRVFRMPVAIAQSAHAIACPALGLTLACGIASFFHGLIRCSDVVPKDMISAAKCLPTILEHQRYNARRIRRACLRGLTTSGLIARELVIGMAGKVSKELQEIIRKCPKLFADLIRQPKEVPDHAILRVVREVRDGDW